jgi:hypothetical protein
MASELTGQLERGEDLDVFHAHLERGSTYDLESADGRVKYMSDALKPARDPEPLAPLALDASDEERVAHMTARMNGAPVEDPNSEE